jgi:hypothetical protein
MDFEILGVISEVKTFAESNGVRIRHYLNTTYAGGRKMYWRHCKGRATVQYSNGEIWDAEVHWFESHGLGRCHETVKHRIRRLDK